MVQRTPHHLFSYAEYLRREEDTELRHEWLDGEVFALAGGSPTHANLIAEVTYALRNALGRGPCRVFTADLRVRVRETGLATYPDVTVVCGEPELDAEDENTVTNPTVLVEVLSPSTEAYDRGKKLQHYQQIPSLRHVLLVSQDARRIEVVSRSDAGEWSTRVFDDATPIELPGIGARISLDGVYGAADR